MVRTAHFFMRKTPLETMGHTLARENTNRTHSDHTRETNVMHIGKNHQGFIYRFAVGGFATTTAMQPRDLILGPDPAVPIGTTRLTPSIAASWRKPCKTADPLVGLNTPRSLRTLNAPDSPMLLTTL